MFFCQALNPVLVWSLSKNVLPALIFEVPCHKQAPKPLFMSVYGSEKPKVMKSVLNERLGVVNASNLSEILFLVRLIKCYANLTKPIRGYSMIP